MDPLKVSAQFAAFVWYAKHKTDQRNSEIATRFARKHWPAFLHLADKGLGTLLIRIAESGTETLSRRVSQRRSARTGRRPGKMVVGAV